MAAEASVSAESIARLANEGWVDCATPESLLLEIVGDIPVVAALRACQVSETSLAEALRARIEAEARRNQRSSFALASLWRRRRRMTDPVVERVLTRSLIRAQASGTTQVKSIDVLMSLFHEPGCAAGELLREHGVTRYDALNWINHRIAKGAEPAVPPKPQSPWILCGIVLHNDHYTPMEFVVHVLETVFDKSREDAVRLMLQVHESGSAECGVFAYDQAVAKVAAVTDLGRTHQHALRCVVEIKTAEGEGADAELLT